jgi:hypothetical protein
MENENDKYGPQDMTSLDKEIEDVIHQIILACGVRQLKEKVSLLYMTIDYIFTHNKKLLPLFTEEVTLH